MKWGGDRRSDQVANLHLENISQSTAAELLNVSPRLVATVKAVEREAPELVEKIARGDFSVTLRARACGAKRRMICPLPHARGNTKGNTRQTGA
jgi:hypothetical protein